MKPIERITLSRRLIYRADYLAGSGVIGRRALYTSGNGGTYVGTLDFGKGWPVTNPAVGDLIIYLDSGKYGRVSNKLQLLNPAAAPTKGWRSLTRAVNAWNRGQNSPIRMTSYNSTFAVVEADDPAALHAVHGYLWTRGHVVAEADPRSLIARIPLRAS